MRRMLIATIAVGIAVGAAVPALAGGLVKVSGEANNGICVTVSDLTTQCVDLGQPGAPGK